MTVTEDFRAARDRLLALRGDYTAARQEFEWPRFQEFNFALDWFDQIAADPAKADRPALVIVEQDGTATRRSFADLSARSAQVANWLRAQGVRRGDRMIIMLGNQVELWELMLAGIKLGIVMIPTTTLMGPADLQDRVERGGASWAAVGSANIAKFAGVPGDYTLIEIGGGGDAGTHAQRALQYAKPRARRKTSPRTRRPWPTRPCCSTSPPAPRPRPSSWSTRTPPTRWATCPPCSGSGWSRATCT